MIDVFGWRCRLRASQTLATHGLLEPLSVSWQEERGALAELPVS